jgi:hypothetical protein
MRLICKLTIPGRNTSFFFHSPNKIKIEGSPYVSRIRKEDYADCPFNNNDGWVMTDQISVESRRTLRNLEAHDHLANGLSRTVCADNKFGRLY